MFNDREGYNSPEYRSWRFHVFTRDGWTCELCKAKGKELNAHHIVRFADAPHLRFAVSNGITLCKECHDNIVTGREREFEDQFKKAIALKNIIREGKKRMPKGGYTGGHKGFSGPKWKPRNPRLRL